jgi:putative tRNA adenosine deaminase-associated protein
MLRRRGVMSEFDDEEYESFELDGAGRSAESVKKPTGGDSGFDEDLEDDDDFDDADLEDAADDEIDFVLAAYREDGQPYVQSLGKDLANDLDELIVQLRRLPGDAGALGFVSLVEEVFVITRVRGQHVQVLLSDAAASGDWPSRGTSWIISARSRWMRTRRRRGEPIGDLGILADLGLSDFDMGAIIDNLDLSSVEMLVEVADKIKLNPQFRKAVKQPLGERIQRAEPVGRSDVAGSRSGANGGEAR